ncbi:MAG: hypothetical protein FWF08_08140, partial [Oscillospiraceae bacterium]|nr:hypothetical protein [Oscillospiraceae bacterium]
YIKSDGILLNETGWMKPGEYFGNECYKIYLDNGNVSLINKNGALLNETGWKDIVWANDGKSIIAKVQLDSGNWTYLNKDGALFNKTGWKDIEFFQFNDDGIYKIRLDSGKWTLMDNNGTLIDKTGWNDIDYSYPNKKNIVLVQPDSGNWTILKNDGTLLDEKGWDIPVECIVNGIYLKCLADKYEIKENNYNEWAFINRDSETVYKAGFWGESIFYNGYFNAGRHKDGVIRFCDMKGNKLIDREFKHLYAVDLYKIEREKTSEAFYYIDVNDNFGVIKYTQKSADLPAAADPTVAVADNPDAGHPDIPKTGVYFPAALYIFIVISSIFTIKKFYFSKKSLTPSATAAPSASR